MVSRRKILSRSRDDLNLDQTFSPQEEEEDVWYQKEKLYKEHIQEVLDKWTQIDDEIWAKVIVFERNRRVAKAYARAPVLTINGSDDGFDGMRIGLCGFDNPMRDQKTEEYKRHIGQGVKIKMDDAGNILVRRYAKSNVYVKSTASAPNEETSIGADILKLPNQALESEKIVKLFDMKKFQSNVNRELRRAYPDRRRLETQCLSVVAFVKSENDILDCPVWVLIVNVVAMDMLKSKLPPVQRPIVDIKNRPRIPIPDEDPYSVAGNGSGGSSGSSGFGAGSSSGHHSQQQQHAAAAGMGLGMHTMNGAGMNGGTAVAGHVAATREQLLLQTQQLAHKRSEKPPKLPPRDNIYSHDIIPKPDYDDIEVDTRIKLSRGKSDKGKDNKKYDDPYYCGLRARVPNFVKTSKSSKEHKEHVSNGTLVNGNAGNTNGNSNGSNMNTLSQKKNSMIHMSMTAPNLHAMHVAAPQPPPHMHPHHIQQQQMMAAAAAHAVHHHHPAAAAAHLVPQHPMWQTRSFESGIGIYDSSSIGIGCQPQQQQQQQQQQLNAVTANFLMDHHNNSNNNKNNKKNKNKNNNNNQMNHAQAQQITLHAQAQAQSQVQAQAQAQAQQLQQQKQQLHNALPQLLSAAAPMRLPADPAHGMDGHEHEHVLNNSNNNKNHNSNIYFSVQQQQQQQQRQRQHHFPNLEETRQRHHHHHHNEEESQDLNNNNNNHHNNHRHHSRNCARRQLPPSMRDCFAPPHTDSDYPDPDLIYADAHPPPLPSNMRSSRSRFRRITRELQQTLSPHRLRTSRTRRHAGSAVGSNCNCVSCYTLAPLFGVAQPARPPRSLSQQQLRLHQQLSGSLADIPPPPPPPPLPPLSAVQMRATHAENGAGPDGANGGRREASGASRNKAFGQSGGNLVKWCSESDVSFLNPRRKRYLAPSESCTYDEGFGEADVVENVYDVGGARNTESPYRHDKPESPHYVNDCDYRRADAVPLYNEHKGQTRDREAHERIGGKKKTYNEYAMQTRRYGDSLYTADETDWDATHFDRYTYRQRQLGTPSPSQSHFERTDGDEMQIDGRRGGAGNRSGFVHSPALLRHKSLSIESFFEQPNEEGSLYMYGGRKRIVKAPSTTILYDRLRGKEERGASPITALDMKRARKESENRKYHDENLYDLQEIKRHKLGMHKLQKNREDNAAPLEKPMLPPPCWRGKKSSNCSSEQFVMDSKIAVENTKTPTTTKNTNATPTRSTSFKQLGGSIVAATTAVFEMKVHNQKRQQQQEKLKQHAEIKQMQQKQKKQQKQQHLNNCEQSAKLANAEAQAQINKLDNNNNNSKESKNFILNNSKCQNSNAVKNTNVTTTSAQQQIPKRANLEALHQQQQQIQKHQSRLSRSDSRVDASDMESIYGYLKPRKPRSLSLKRIQILDY